jgi:hypothetical protein
LHSDLLGGLLYIPQIVRGELDGCRDADILLEPVQFGRAGDRQDSGALGKEPSKRDLRRRSAFPPPNFFEQVNQSVVRLARLGENRGMVLRKPELSADIARGQPA